MAAAVAKMPSNGEAMPDSPVDLSTIPISPEGGNRAKMAPGEDEQITVFHDPDNFNVKHPLMNKWTLWFTKPPSGKVGFCHEVFEIYPNSEYRVITGMTC